MSELSVVAAAIKKAWRHTGDVPFPLYDGEALVLAQAAIATIDGYRRKHKPCDIGLFSDDASQLDLVEMLQQPTNEELTTTVIEALAMLPELCASRNLSDDSPILIKRGESGYYPAPLGLDVDAFNARHGVTAAQREAMEIGSMFGWDVPGVRHALECK